MLLVLLLGIADFGRVFSAGIIVEAAARDGAEAAAQEYLQLRRTAATPTAADYARIHDVALDAVCADADPLPNQVASGASCTMPVTAVCIHDDPARLPGYACPQATGTPDPGTCSRIAAAWPSQWTGGLPSVEVRVCYRFTTLFNLQDLQLPLGSGISIGDIYLQKDRTFAVADYGY